MSTEHARLRILEHIEAGQLSPAEGIRQLQALGAAADLPPAADKPEAPASQRAPNLAHWRRWWVLPFAVGLALTMFSSGLLFWALRAADFRLSGWFFLALAPFTVSVAVLALAAASRSARWLHLRVDTGRAEWPRQIAISLPLPLGLTVWALRTFGHRLPQLRQTGVDEVLLALGETTSPQTPFYVEVDQGRDGEKVQVYIG